MRSISFNQIQSKNPLTNMYLGSFLLAISIFDVLIYAFFNTNILSFLPSKLSTFLPLVFGFIGLGIIRMEYSGIAILDKLNKNINTNNFNALLTLLIIFAFIKATPPSLSWMIFDANISGDTKEACTGTGACWTYIKVWFKRFMYGMYPNDLHWRINSAFILVIALGFVGYFFKENMKKYLALYYVIIYPIIAFLIIYYLISGGSFGFLPEDFFMDKLVRVIIAITLFEAAYCAEVIRGGLQALPRGQYDAAKSLGMGYWKMHIFVILPQALKLVIPGIANTFLALVKDTPLIFVVGLAEIAGMLALAKTNPKWLGFAMEGYIFAAIIFWIICYAMSKYSYNLENKYKTER